MDFVVSVRTSDDFLAATAGVSPEDAAEDDAENPSRLLMAAVRETT
jgi:hypothetical protein